MRYLLVLLFLLFTSPGWAALSDSGLLVRYYVDEATSGSAPAAVLDASGVADDFDLTIDYGSGNLAYTEAGGMAGLISSSETGTQHARKTIVTSDKIQTALNGATAATLEVVVDVDSFNASGGRIFGLQDRAGGNGIFMLRGSGTTWQFTINNAGGDTIADLPEGERIVLHIVMDTTLVDHVNRLMYSLNGGTLTGFNTIAGPSETLTVSNAHDLIMFNRDSGSGPVDRSIVGTIYYAALYDEAFDQTRVNTHYSTLAADDDTPSGGGGGGVVPRMLLLGVGLLLPLSRYGRPVVVALLVMGLPVLASGQELLLAQSSPMLTWSYQPAPAGCTATTSNALVRNSTSATGTYSTVATLPITATSYALPSTPNNRYYRVETACGQSNVVQYVAATPPPTDPTIDQRLTAVETKNAAQDLALSSLAAADTALQGADSQLNAALAVVGSTLIGLEGRIASLEQAAPPPLPTTNITATQVDADRIEIRGLNCASLKTTGTGLRRVITCVH